MLHSVIEVLHSRVLPIRFVEKPSVAGSRRELKLAFRLINNMKKIIFCFISVF